MKKYVMNWRKLMGMQLLSPKMYCERMEKMFQEQIRKMQSIFFPIKCKCQTCHQSSQGNILAVKQETAERLETRISLGKLYKKENNAGTTIIYGVYSVRLAIPQKIARQLRLENETFFCLKIIMGIREIRTK